MPSAQIIHLDHYRKSSSVQPAPAAIDKIRHILESATPAIPKPEIIETRMRTIEGQLSKVMNLLSETRGL